MNCGKKSIAGFLVLLPFCLFAQTVDFSFSTDDGLYCNPQNVTFTQNCSGTPDGFIWRFGNGVSGIHPVESVTYSTPGTYTVTLIAIYADIAISVSKTVVINPTPTISLVPDQHERCQPGVISFTAPGSPSIVSYDWDFGDGSPILTTPTNSASHTFTTYNSFIVVVKGKTAAGCYSTAKDTVLIERFGITDAFIDPLGGCIPAPITFTVIPDPPAGDPVVSYTWDFGDGSALVTTATNTINHIYNITTPITTASVTMTTSSGCVKQHIYDPFGLGTPPTNPFLNTTDGQTTYCASETIEFRGGATNANYYVWQYGDGNQDSTEGAIITHRYRTLGPKQVIMIPYFNGCRGESDTINLNIIGVVADYTFHNICSARNHFIYENQSLGNITSFRWTFSDIPNLPDAVHLNISHDFPLNGAFTTKFYLYDEITGCSDSLITDQFTATPIFTSSRSRVCKDSVIVYTVENPYPVNSGYVYIYHVDGPIVAHSIYPQLELKPNLHGIFNDFVIIDGPGNNTCNDTLYLPNQTIVGGPVLDFSMPTSSCLLNNSFPITNNTHPFFPADPITQWSWDFGDYTTSNVKTPPPHSYDHSGTFWMHFKATDTYGCAQMDSLFIRVYPTPEVYVLPRTHAICSGDSLQLLGFTIDNLQWTTNYNISCLSCDTAIVKPAVSTDYVAKAMNVFGCSNTDTAKIKVYEPFVLQVSPADTSLCIGGKVQFKTNVNGIVNWSPPDFLSAVDIRNPLSIPDTTITYRIIVNDSASCFADTATAVIHVNYKPTVNAGNDQVIPFYNSFTLSPVYSTDVVSYRWVPYINQLSCSTCPVVSGVASQSTLYTIEVTNQHGCKATDDVAVIVACNQSNLNLPSAFTPNNDGLNDQFYPLARGYKMINKFVIYNRWGNKIFERYNFSPNTPSLGWNGNNPGKQPLDSGVFVWMIEATCDLGEKVELKGTVMLMR